MAPTLYLALRFHSGSLKSVASAVIDLHDSRTNTMTPGATSWGAKTPMLTRSKIRLDAIEQIKRTLDALPQHHDDEVTKKQAIRMLIPNIEAIRTKGYGLPAIASFLSDHGLPITVPYLRSVLRPRHHDGDAKKERRGKPRQRGGQTAPSDTTNDVRPKGHDEERITGVTRVDAPETPPAEPKGNTVGARREARAGAAAKPLGGRPMFVPREDSDEI